jgi:hypothetical protein
MSYIIDRFINEIKKEDLLNNYYEKLGDKYIFYGDGFGDFEERSDKTTKNCLENYIKDCEEQIKLAKEVLERDFNED